MATIREVIEGLQKGYSYCRTLELGGVEIVRPILHTLSFSHTVDGNYYGGYNEIEINDLRVLQDKWAYDGWELLIRL